MMNPHQTALISLLLGSFPSFQSGDAEAALAAYQFVIRDQHLVDLEGGVSILVNGEYPGHDGRFAPTAPQLATAIRMARDKRLESDRRSALRLPPPLEPEISEEERERVKAGFQELVAKMAEKARTDDAEADRKHRAQLAKTNARFDPPQDDASISARLIKYTLGSPESERESA